MLVSAIVNCHGLSTLLNVCSIKSVDYTVTGTVTELLLVTGCVGSPEIVKPATPQCRRLAPLKACAGGPCSLATGAWVPLPGMDPHMSFHWSAEKTAHLIEREQILQVASFCQCLHQREGAVADGMTDAAL